MSVHHGFASLLAIFLLLGAAGCMVGPNFHSPANPYPNRWSEAGEDSITTQPLAAVQWWRLFKDPKIDSLITRAAESNLDLQLARERILQARAQRQVVAADLLPTFDLTSAYSRIRKSPALNPPTKSSGGSSGSGSGTATKTSTPKPSLESDLFQAGFDASWEIDIFGGTRRAVQAANADIVTAEHGRNAVLVSLYGEVAGTYIQLRGLQRQMEITSQTIVAQQKTYDLTLTRFEGGIVSRLDVDRARAQLETTRSQAPAFQAAILQTIHALSVLLGKAPGELKAELAPAGPIPVPPGAVAVGLPSELLHRRPDIMAAESIVAAATARVGVAVADLYPKFFLTGSIGTTGLEAGDLLKTSARYWSYGPSMRWPILDFGNYGRIHGNIKIQDSVQRQALINYQKAILNALQETEDAFVAYGQEQLRRQSLQEAVAADERAVDLAQRMYAAGVSDFLNVLDAERALYTMQIVLAQNETNVSADLVALYKALGGGWEVK